MADELVHGSAVVVGECGVLIEGGSGSGKTSLVLALLADADPHRCFARLVGDDRLVLTAVNGRLVARPHSAIAGRIERRGVGIVPIAHEPACLIGLCVALGADGDGERMPAQAPRRRRCGIDLPLLRLRAEDGARENSFRVFSHLSFR